MIVRIIDDVSGKGVGALDFLDDERDSMEGWKLSQDAIEKWWCLGDFRNRVSMWVQGKKVSRTSVRY